MNLTTISHPMILNYYSPIRVSPTLRVDRPLSLLLGAGDIVHSGVSNVEQYGMYDMMICRPENAESLQKNIDKLTETGPVICILDVTNPLMLNVFIQEFRGRFSCIDAHWAHCPHFALETLDELLAEDGTASNIFERSLNIVNINTFLAWIKDEYINSYSNISMSTARVISDGAIILNETDAANLETVLREKILYMNTANKNIHLSDEVLYELPSYRHFTLQTIFASLLHDRITPLNLLGAVGLYCAKWDTESRIQLVLRKSSPPYWENILAQYVQTHGRNSVVERAELILDGIRSDIAKFMTWQSKAKYATFLRHMTKNVLPFVQQG
jgi:hypothetical protein